MILQVSGFLFTKRISFFSGKDSGELAPAVKIMSFVRHLMGNTFKVPTTHGSKCRVLMSTNQKHWYLPSFLGNDFSQKMWNVWTIFGLKKSQNNELWISGSKLRYCDSTQCFPRQDEPQRGRKGFQQPTALLLLRVDVWWILFVGMYRPSSHNHGRGKWVPPILVSFQYWWFSTEPWLWEKGYILPPWKLVTQPLGISWNFHFFYRWERRKKTNKPNHSVLAPGFFSGYQGPVWPGHGEVFFWIVRSSSVSPLGRIRRLQRNPCPVAECRWNGDGTGTS